MTGEHQPEDGIWSVPALHEHLETLLTSTALNLRDHITQQIAQTAAAIMAQEKATALALAALNAMLAERDRAVILASNGQANAQAEFKDTMLARLAILNEHKAQVQTLIQTFVHKEQVAELREMVVRIEARAAENRAAIAALSPADWAAYRLRLEVVEARPLAMGPEAQGEMKAATAQNGRDIGRAREDIHDLRNKVQIALGRTAQFTEPEEADIRRLLRAALKADVEEFLTPDENRGVRVLLAGQGVRTRRQLLFEAAVISGVVLTLLSLVLVMATRFFG